MMKVYNILDDDNTNTSYLAASVHDLLASVSNLCHLFGCANSLFPQEGNGRGLRVGRSQKGRARS